MKWENVTLREKLQFAYEMGKRRLNLAICRFKELAEFGRTEIPCPVCKMAIEKSKGISINVMDRCAYCPYPKMTLVYPRENIGRCMEFRRGADGSIGKRPTSAVIGIDYAYIADTGISGERAVKWATQVAKDYQEMLDILIHWEPTNYLGEWYLYDKDGTLIDSYAIIVYTQGILKSKRVEYVYQRTLQDARNAVGDAPIVCIQGCDGKNCNRKHISIKVTPCSPDDHEYMRIISGKMGGQCMPGNWRPQ